MNEIVVYNFYDKVVMTYAKNVFFERKNVYKLNMILSGVCSNRPELFLKEWIE